jgi:hypothetical protein
MATKKSDPFVITTHQNSSVSQSFACFFQPAGCFNAIMAGNAGHDFCIT